ncbi:MAG: family peptidase [Gammaproteobacteria bacterium]|nr:family peptidase [Gammaproteobacteria bacterium]
MRRREGGVAYIVATILGTAGTIAGAVENPPRDTPYEGTIALKVDVTDLERHVFNVHEVIPVVAGPLTLLYPEWLPGNHAPRGPIDALGGLIINANGKRVEWVRDPVNVYAFQVQVPTGATHLDIDFQYAAPLTAAEGRINVTPEIIGLQWNAVVLYPAGYYASRIAVAAELDLPDGWEFGSALDVENRHGSSVWFKHVSLDMLVDSPVFAGRYFRTIVLDPVPAGTAPGATVAAAPKRGIQIGPSTEGAVVRLDIVADSPASFDIKPEQIAAHRKLVQETYALFGARHFDHYDLLLALSDHFGDIGLEHHRSSENRRLPGYFLDWDKEGPGRSLLPHEFTHSWNGKFRRPAGLVTANFNVPMQNDLLWIYEGLTQYLEGVLAARSGLWSADFARQDWAYTAANMDHDRPGRAWRDMEDTTYQPIITARRPLSWLTWQRTEDYYPEGALIWLDVDTKIRELSGDKMSLDDFARGFFGGADGTLGPVPYTLPDITRALNGVAPYDWEKFFAQRLHSHGPGAPLDGLARGGWKLVYTEVPTDFLKQLEEQRKAADFSFSLGFNVSMRDYGQVTEVVWGSPGFDAGLTAGTTLVAVNGREYRPERLREALMIAHSAHMPIELIVKNLDRYRVVRIPYYDGPKYPRLERVEKSVDRLAAIVKPRT